MTKEQIEAIFEKFDNNGDGKMSKKEFKQLMALSKKGGVGVEQSSTGRKESNNRQLCLPSRCRPRPSCPTCPTCPTCPRYCIKNEIIRLKISEPCTYSAPEDGGHNRINFSSFVDFLFLDRIHIGM